MKEQNTGKILGKAREMQGMSQMQVATLAGINLGQYQRLEYGLRDFDQCSMKVGIAICYVLNLDPFLLVLKKTEW
ncbi:MAG: helix-turn-helix transcriptional regulator [Clostridiales bacterium]|nr:helix-turn-helix transcriptional regulator [Clostridiales bacterium]